MAMKPKKMMRGGPAKMKEGGMAGKPPRRMRKGGDVKEDGKMMSLSDIRKAAGEKGYKLVKKA